MLSFSEFVPVIPALILSVGAMILLLSEVFLTGTGRTHQLFLAVLTSALAGVTALVNVSQPPHLIFAGFGVNDPFSSAITCVVCLGALLTVLSASGFLRHRNAERGEFYALVLFAAAGMSLLALSNELVMLFISIEILSVATYALTAYLRRGPRPSEAGFKYFILGAFSSAILLYGVSLLYGATGTTHLTQMGSLIGQAMEQRSGLVFVGVGLVATGLAFKIAAVPFHMWTPDVYEGASTPVTALMSASVKAAAFAALVRFFLAVSPGLPKGMLLGLFSTLAFLTLVGGNLLALPQRNVKRMLAYSSIAHVGYLLIGVTSLFAGAGEQVGFAFLRVTASENLTKASGNGALNAEIVKGIVFYLLAYTFTAVGAFATLAALERREDEERATAWDLERFAGLAQRRPGWAFAMAVFMLSLGGIPPTLGFMSKLLIFRNAIDSGLWGLTVVGVLSSAAGVYYYLRVVVYMYMRPADDAAVLPERRLSTDAVLGVACAAVLFLGIFPGSISDWLVKSGVVQGVSRANRP